MNRFNKVFRLPTQPFVRSVYVRTKAPPKVWTKRAIDEKVLDLLYDYANVPSEEVIKLI